MSSPESDLAPIKERATVVCVQGQRVLLVARAASRWALPGGTIKTGETPLGAAHRELQEETGLVGLDLKYVMHFGGLSKLHHVFIGELLADLRPQASNEIARCKLFRHDAIAQLRASIPTKKIIELAYSSDWSA
ncbi:MULTISPECIES: NUDIX hydrolase [unclassified Burkholderia]|uniref:NUDIX hydrolase n=1 Tax=unclassified Burkholderia TaxID=2613784 RepID=UPI00141E4100|nr:MULTISPECIES: NUDIX hydrolase [unclassified Burkholderia]NIE57785.1 NUDIX domain-containing protein [Burkholderia sp. Ap-955]NIF10770.1 NUDIX domain-containing protein [Burkholderia sp. Ax-1735]NIG02506.1 NUDIX domain-containing protein [Burkholderia sp. Tr-849]